MEDQTNDSRGDPLAARELAIAQNTPELLEEHKKITQGKIRTRFPPEPNGYLHIGHAKSMNMNFELAFEKLGVPPEKRETYFRYDDTNPEAESHEYITSLAEDVHWLGWTPVRTTYSSDYFQDLYDLAVELIRRGKAYVCHQTGEEISKSREIAKNKVVNPEYPGDPCSPWRDRPVEESLRLFDEMRQGRFEEGKACLRMKMDMSSPNPNMWDSVAYRVKFVPHPRTGDAWCVYPTYDYTHCLVDSLEHVDYSICTLEFETRRESYYWLLDALDLYRPKVYEFSRLSLTHTVMSKRKLLKIVESKRVRGWDDPRLCTISGLRRRGYTPQAINDFCKDIGVSRVNNTVDLHRLEFWVRQTLHPIARRAMAVLEPLKVVLTNYPEDKTEKVQVPDFPFAPEQGHHEVCFGREVYIDRSDFRMEDAPSFFGLAPGKEVMLRYAYNITCKEVVKDSEGNVCEILAEVDFEKKNKPKGVLQWVAGAQRGSKPLEVEIRMYETLFTSEFPGTDPSRSWEDEINPKSETVYSGAMVDPSVPSSIQTGECLQFERLGFFTVDKDSCPDKPVFNLTVTLKESSSKDTKSGQKGKSRKEEQELQMKENMRLAKIHPKDFFREEHGSKYSEYDEEGIPTHDASGEPLAKGTIKKLKKEKAKHEKLYNKYKDA